MQDELAHSVVTMRLVQTEKLLEWMAGTASEDAEALQLALGAVRDALSTIRCMHPVSRR